MTFKAEHDEERGEYFPSSAEEAAAEAAEYEVRKQTALVTHRLAREFAQRAYAEIPHGADKAVFQDLMVDEFAASLAGIIEGSRIADRILGVA